MTVIPAENIKVAVRVRPFSENETKANSKCIVQMDGKVTTIMTKDNKEQRFTFDYSYWSKDGCKTEPNGYIAPDPSHKNGSKYADQKAVHQDLGADVLKNAKEGYNSTIFAYGQTGSGKSYSIIGDKANEGIVPRVCKDLFTLIDASKKESPDREDEVSLCMMEIYNEVPKDLLNMKHPLKIRESPGKGFYAEGLTEYPCKDYNELKRIMDEGNLARTINATKMNQTSSRAHTIVSICFKQKSKSGDSNLIKTAVIQLVDLAGSERVSKTEATGGRLKEGAAINQSLTNLGICMHALATASKQVPYRNSCLTKVLCNSLGGNSKTMMVAAISPSEVNRDESISTLNYADSAKRIKTAPKVNEDETASCIKRLQEENEKLKKMLESGQMSPALAVGGNSAKEIEEMRKMHEEEMKALIENNMREMANMKATFDQKLANADNLRRDSIPNGMSMTKVLEECKSKPHFANLNPDLQLSGRIIYICKPGVNIVGNEKNSEADIKMLCASILPTHARVTVDDKHEIFMEPASTEAKVLHNGCPITKKIVLHHNDRILFGPTALYLFCCPKERDESKSPFPLIDYNFAQGEIARNCGIVLPTMDGSQNLESVLLHEELLRIFPFVQEANCISAELDKRVKFEIIPLRVPIANNPENIRCELHIEMKNLENGKQYIWNKEKFENRLCLMKEMYANYDNQMEDANEYEDPFCESPDAEVELGSVQVFTQPMCYSIEIKDEYEICDYKGNEVGTMNLEIDPCSKDGIEYTVNDDKFVEKPEELIGQTLYFLVRIHSVKGLPNRYTAVHCRYRMLNDNEETLTKVCNDPTNAKFEHSRVVCFPSITIETLRKLQEGSFSIIVMGKQHPRKSAMAFARGKNTREMLQNDKEILVKTKCLMNGFNMDGRMVDPNKQSVVVELLLLKKHQQRMQLKLDGCRKMVEIAQNLGCKSLPLGLLRDVISAQNGMAIEKAIAQLEGVSKTMPQEPHIHKNGHVKQSSTCQIL
ncbi:hypothetical protein CHUAL_010462 [Chamberlinius hualienensis]